MDGEDSFVALVHCSRKFQKSKRHGVKFTDREPVSIFIRSSSTLAEIKLSILQKLGTRETKLVKKLFYEIPITVVSTGVRYETFVIGSDEDLQVLFNCSFPEVRIPEMFAKLEDRVDSSGASAPGPQSTTVGGASTSLPVVAVVVPPPEPKRAGVEFEVGPDRVENALCDDDSDEEPVDIGGDSEDDIPRGVRTAHGGSDSGSQEYPPHLSSLNLEAIGQHQNVEATFYGQGMHDGTGLTEFQIGQSFQSKEEAVLSMKDYSIRRGVEYRVMESDNLKYKGRCKEFSNGCTWLIRIVMRKRKSTWEVRRYNGPHTCMATSISSDHKQLDYHVICARIFSLVRADASVLIKVLQEATETTYGFKPSYRKVWLAKQKAVAQIYGDWEESYADLPRWILGVTFTMDGSIALLKTSPVRVGDQVDEERVYFHRMFWTFPPCVEAFRHCKPLVSIDGTHLYGKYGGTLLSAIAQDGNSNILPVAFALVEGKNAESWSYFLSNLRRHVTSQEGILVISDRHNGIKAALESPDSGWRPLYAYTAFCIRHVAANFALTFKGQDVRRWLVNAAYVKTEAEFDYWFDIMRSENPAMCDWANRMDYEMWTQHKYPVRTLVPK
ncbi:uncharacterized protein LOC107461590 [Arachis duranensis]|uniref:Uncharacterized protein LOC107461590 n=1 Tax=Arachis duranensis TaxID=130453 RepID=A0A6P4BV10_ARADU|nr:uncharacterized protein LOC107461590 [Arachis duranensis]